MQTMLHKLQHHRNSTRQNNMIVATNLKKHKIKNKLHVQLRLTLRTSSCWEVRKAALAVMEFIYDAYQQKTIQV